MKRKIHIVGILSSIVAYISIILIVNAYVQTTIINKGKTIKMYQVQWIISVISSLTLSLSTIFVIGTGFCILHRLENAPQKYKKLNIVTGIFYLLGGMIVSPIISLYLFFKE